MQGAVGALSWEEKGFVLGAALAHRSPVEATEGLPSPASARCREALEFLAAEPKPARASELAALIALVRAPVPAGVGRLHPEWLRDRLQAETSPVIRAVTKGLPPEVCRVAAEILRARERDDGGADRVGAGELCSPEPFAGGVGPSQGPTYDRSELQRVVFSGLVPLAGPGAPNTPAARELIGLPFDALTDAVERGGVEILVKQLRQEGPAAVLAVAQRMPSAPGRRLLALAGLASPEG